MSLFLEGVEMNVTIGKIQIVDKMKKHLALVYFLFLFVINTQANEGKIKIISVDSTFNVPLSKVPFDESFYLKVPKVKESSIITLRITKPSKNGNGKFLSYERKRARAAYGIRVDGFLVDIFNSDSTVMTLSLTIGKGKLEKAIIDKGKFALIKIFPLNPKETYQIEYSYYQASKKDLRSALIRLGTFSSSNAADPVVSAFNSLSSDINKTDWLKNKILKHKKGRLDTALKYLLLHEEKIKKEKNGIQKLIKDNHARLLRINAIMPNLDQFFECYKSIYEKCYSCDTEFKSKCLECPDPLGLKKHLIAASISNSTSQHLIDSGMVSIRNSSSTQIADWNDYDVRLKNLKETTLFMEKILSISYYEDNDCYTKSISTLESLNKKVDSLKKFVSTLSEIENRLIKYEVEKTFVVAKFESGGFQVKSGGAATVSTKGKFSVRPDLGLAFASNLLVANETSDPFHTIVPFLGIRFNFRPLDPDHTFQNIPYKTFWHRSSINISYSLTTLSDNETRFDLNKNRNFLIGYGFRLNNAVNLSTGAILFRRENPNPFISNKPMTAMPYVGVSIDFDIFDNIKDLFNVF